MHVTTVLDPPARTGGRARRAPRVTVAVPLLTAAIIGGVQVPGAGAAAAAPTEATIPSQVSLANVRSGPGLGHSIVGTAPTGTALTLVCFSLGDDRRWYQLSTGGYISERVLDAPEAAALPACDGQAAPPPADPPPVEPAPVEPAPVEPATVEPAPAPEDAEDAPTAAEPVTQAAVTPPGQLVPSAAHLKALSFDRWGCAAGHPAPCVSVIGGWRARGSVPGSDHPKGKAIDVMVSTGGRDAVGAQQELGDVIAKYMKKNAKTLSVKYIIWDNRIWAPRSGGWKTYCRSTCPQGSVNPTFLHQDHVHISVW